MKVEVRRGSRSNRHAACCDGCLHRAGPFQLRLSPLPVRQDSGQQPVEFRAVMMATKVAKLVDDHVINAIHRGGHERGIQQHPALLAATSPAARHPTKREWATLDSEALNVFGTSLESLRDLLASPRCQPRGKQACRSVGAGCRAGDDLQTAA